MYVLRCTRILLSRLGPLTPPGEGPPPPTTTRLGDWYATRLNIGRHRLVLCTSERTLLSVVVPAKDLPGLPSRLTWSLVTLLRHLRVPPPVIAAEVRAMEHVRFDRTANRSVLGMMNQFSQAVDDLFRRPLSVVYLDEIDRQLSRELCRSIEWRTPAEATVAALEGPGTSTGDGEGPRPSA
jgi:hypothetical protein